MLKLVTISRISKEKGFERMLQVEKLLTDAGVQFIWDCYGDLTTNYARQIVKRFQYVKFKGVTTTPKETMLQYDYLAQLSDTEGFAYSIYEAMQMKVPVIATDFPSIHEMIKDGKNGYILKMDLSNFDAQRLTQVPRIVTFREKSNEQSWIKFLNMAKQKPARQAAAKNPPELVSVTVVKLYHDTVLGREISPGYSHDVTKERAQVLVAAKVCEYTQTISV